MNFWLILAIKCYFWPISACFRLMRPTCMIFNLNLQFFTFIHFLRRSASSASILAFLDIIFDLLDQFFWKHQISTIFYLFVYKFNALVHVSYVKIKKIFHYAQNLNFLKNPPWNLIFFWIFTLSPCPISMGKWKMFWEINCLLLWIFEQCVQ